ncbi:cation diffusion facilitator family transporter [Pelistega sp. MC2]|uniref:cation diffusion facilitator family transporter n=1 Tax=Pelistega sp. MC2 TaxID=1720297 RepID=UPI0008D92695|nr:cation diffusion facilitator family transporter [Pelistega sp. MC2]
MTDAILSDKQAAASHSTWVSVIVNLLLSILQIVIGIFASSSSLISDAIHSLSDLVSDIAVLIANKFSNMPSDDTHQYGHYRFENIASLFIGLLLIGIGLSMIWHAGDRLFNHTDSVAQVHYYALIVAVFVVVAKELLFRYMLAIGKRVNSTMLITNAWHARSDALSSLIVLFAIGANLLGISWADIVASLIVGAMIAHMGLKFTWNSIHDLSDHAATQEEINTLRAILQETPGIVSFHDFKTRKSADFIHIDVHLDFPGSMSIKEAHDIALLAINRLKAKGNVLSVTTHFDPMH